MSWEQLLNYYESNCEGFHLIHVCSDERQESLGWNDPRRNGGHEVLTKEWTQRDILPFLNVSCWQRKALKSVYYNRTSLINLTVIVKINIVVTMEIGN